MEILLYLLLFLFLYSVVKVAWKFYTIYRKLHNVTKQFRDFSSSQNASGYGSYGNATGGSYGNASQAGSDSGSQYSRQSTTTSTGEVIEDRRTEDEINRKIFTQEEGEYVDFEEEK